MILKGSRIASITHARRMAAHLNKDENDIVQLWETSGASLEADLVDMQLLTKLTAGERGIYHAAINPREGETMTSTQWDRAIAAIEEELGFTGQPRCVVYHEKEGRPHLHVCWSMVDIERGRIMDPRQDRPRLQTVAQTLEQEFGHEQTRRHANENTVEITDKERAQAARSGQSPKERKETLNRLWQESENAQGFIDAAREAGYVVAKGDKARIIVVDRTGEPHNLTRQLAKGIKAKQVRARLEGLSLPTLAQAQAQQEEMALAAEIQAAEQEKAAAHTHSQQEQERAAQEAPEGWNWEELMREQRDDLTEAERLTRDAGKKSEPAWSADGDTPSPEERRTRRRTSTRILAGLMSQYMNLPEAERAAIQQELKARLEQDQRQLTPEEQTKEPLTRKAVEAEKSRLAAVQRQRLEEAQARFEEKVEAFRQEQREQDEAERSARDPETKPLTPGEKRERQQENLRKAETLARMMEMFRKQWEQEQAEIRKETEEARAAIVIAYNRQKARDLHQSSRSQTRQQERGRDDGGRTLEDDA